MCLHSTVQADFSSRHQIFCFDSDFIQILASLVKHMHSHHISFLQFIMAKLWVYSDDH